MDKIYKRTVSWCWTLGNGRQWCLRIKRTRGNIWFPWHILGGYVQVVQGKANQEELNKLPRLKSWSWESVKTKKARMHGQSTTKKRVAERLPEIFQRASYMFLKLLIIVCMWQNYLSPVGAKHLKRLGKKFPEFTQDLEKMSNPTRKTEKPHKS